MGMLTRREILHRAGAATLALGSGGLWLPRLAGAAAPASDLGPATLPAGTLATARLEAIAGKRALIKRSYRPPNYETPIAWLNEPYTPNDAFFVRYHLADIPVIAAESWRLRIGGPAAERPAEFTLDDLRRGFETVEVTAVCMCSGNRRGLSDPHVPGVQWGHGAMGNARWSGVRLKDVLARIGVRRDAIEVSFNGADAGAIDKTPDFIKSLPMGKALDDSTLVAFTMNGEPLPHWNGFPARLVVPGWTATYWVKHLTEINVLTAPESNFWMKSAYRMPLGLFPVVDRFMSQETAANTPITEMVINTLITNLTEGQPIKAGEPTTVQGVAWDGGYGITQVLVSTDDGRTWLDAELGDNLGRFAWRRWSHRLTPAKAGPVTVLVRAFNRIGATQTPTAIWNPSGYHNNEIQRLTLIAV